jgi:acetate kinase
MTPQPNTLHALADNSPISVQASAFAAVDHSDQPDGVFLLTLNAGSSSLKFAVFDACSPPAQIAFGAIKGIGSTLATFTLKGMTGEMSEHASIAALDHVRGLTYLLDRLADTLGCAQFAAVGHRVVNGGLHYREPQRVDTPMMAELKRISAFNPVHLPCEIALIEMITARFPQTTQVACFDTAFHQHMPRVARLLPIPRRYEAIGVVRYGFHGLSYTGLMQELLRLAGEKAANGRVVLAHLGQGSSMAAVRGGVGVDTTMGFTPAAGLMMGTRSGDLDPGLVSFLAHTEAMSPAEFDHMINRESGLLGVSETSADMQELLAHETSDTRAAQAVDMYCYQAKKALGAYAAVLAGLDTLVFAGGVGENASAVRARICAGLEFLGLELDATRNQANEEVISSDASRVIVRVIRADEERVIATSVCSLLGLGSAEKTVEIKA